MAEKNEDKPGKKTAAVVNYISLLLIAAFLLLLMTYLMEQRQSAEILDGLRHSVSAMQSVDSLYDENAELREENSVLHQDLYKQQQSDLSKQLEIERLEDEIEEKNLEILALDWFWQLNEAYALDDSDLAEDLLIEMEALELEDYLPLESHSETGHYSPAHRYKEIQKELGIGDIDSSTVKKTTTVD